MLSDGEILGLCGFFVAAIYIHLLCVLQYDIIDNPMFDLICSFIFALAHNIQPRPPYLYINMADDPLIKIMTFLGKIYSNTY